MDVAVNSSIISIIREVRRSHRNTNIYANIFEPYVQLKPANFQT